MGSSSGRGHILSPRHRKRSAVRTANAVRAVCRKTIEGMGLPPSNLLEAFIVFIGLTEGGGHPIEECCFPNRRRSRSGLFATKTTIEEMGFPPIPAPRRLEAVLYSAGSPKWPAAVAFVASEIIG